MRWMLFLAHCWRDRHVLGSCVIRSTRPGAAAATPPPNPKTERYKTDLAAEIDGMKDFTQQMVDQVFSFGELGFQEVETSKYLTGILEEERVHALKNTSPAFPRRGWRPGDRASRSSRWARTSTASRRRRRSPAWPTTIRSSTARPGTARGTTRACRSTSPAALALKKIMERERIARHDSAVAGDRRGTARHQGVFRACGRVQGRRRGALRARRHEPGRGWGDSAGNGWSRSSTTSRARAPTRRPRRGAGARRSTRSS